VSAASVAARAVDRHGSPTLGAGPPILFSDRGCPFAQRVIALADHLGVALERREVAYGERPEGIERYARSAPVPLLVDGDLVLTESRVMLEHLAERHGFAEAFPEELAARTLHRHAMAVTDDVLAPLLFGRRTDVSEGRLDDGLGSVEAAIATADAAPCLLAFHLAPMWQRCLAWSPEGLLTHAIRARPRLGGWLEAAAALPSLERTAHDPAPRDPGARAPASTRS